MQSQAAAFPNICTVEAAAKIHLNSPDRHGQANVPKAEMQPSITWHNET